MKKITEYFIIIFSITLCGNIDAKSKKKELLSYQSVYEIVLDKEREMKN